MRKIISLSLLFVAALTSRAQTDLCFEGSTGLYWPVKVGIKLSYNTSSDFYTSHFNGDSTKLGDHYYLKEITTHKDGRQEMAFWREEKGVVYHYDTAAGRESVELISDPSPGDVWEKYDSTWRYTIISVNSTFSTPYCEYKGLLEVRAEPVGKLKAQRDVAFNLFFKKGVGMVGMLTNGKLSMMLAPDEKNLDERDMIAYGCEQLPKAEIAQCTNSKILEHIQNTYKAPKGKIKHGTMHILFIVGIDGMVEKVTIKETIAGAKSQEDEIIRVLKSLPKFIPAQVADGVPVRCSHTIPVNF
jgi:hypothetical protein